MTELLTSLCLATLVLVVALAASTAAVIWIWNKGPKWNT